MLSSDPKNQFEDLKAKLVEQISGSFPIRDRSGAFEVRVKDVRVDDTLGTDDIKDQLKARLEARSWAAPVKGTVEVVDPKTGKVLVSKDTVLARVPKMTRHYTYIVGGQEKTIANQWRLRPGPYVKATDKDNTYEAQFQLAKGRSFDIQMEPGTGYMFIAAGSRKVPLYSVLKAYGVADDEMKKAWGDEAYRINSSKAKPDRDLKSLYEVWRRGPMDKSADPVKEVKALFEATSMDPEIARANLGVAKSSIDGDVLFRASRKLVGVSAKRLPPDPIDSLRYKELWTSADHITDRIAKSKTDIDTRVMKALGKTSLQERLRRGDSSVLREVVVPDLFQKPLYYAFATSLASNGKQLNPVSMLSDKSLVTIMGPGGIQNPHMISKSNTAIDPSHLGFLDPVFTPESNPGVNTHLAAGVQVKNRKPYIRLFNVRTGKMEDVDAVRAATSNVVLPDQVKWVGGKPKPLRSEIRMSDTRGDMRDDIPWSKADYVIPSAAQIFAAETNLVPFMQNDSAGRTTMSARHMAQSISVVGREAPMVQVEAGAGKTFEQLIGGGFLAHRAPVDGVVRSVGKDEIVIQGTDGKARSVHLYDHYPLNDKKAYLHSTPTVKPGDRVKQGTVLAENNFTRGGTLALGTNLRVGYLANGANHEDGIVISQSAAKKLSSEHLYKPSLFLGKDTKVGKKEFLLAKPAVYSKDSLEKIGDDGVVRVGTRVKPGDPLILALGEKSTKSSAITAESMKRLSSMMRDPFSNRALIWDSDYEGEVIRVAKRGKDIEVHIKTLEPAQVGSKLSTRHSAKGVIASVVPDHEMPHDTKGRHVEMLINPVSVPGRMNPGQILETAAGRIAEKTGKTYVVKNFQANTDYLQKVRDELKAHGVKETEELHDPKTGRRLGEVMVGPHYVFQLEHQADKKTHVRSGGITFKKTGAPQIVYDNDTKIPRGGGHQGAQSLGSLGIYGALAAGLNNNLREMQTLRSDQPQAEQVWAALVSGDLVPPPKVPFVFKKFEHLLKGLGVDLEKNGSTLRVIPRTDTETRALSRGELKDPTATVRGKNDAPIRGGLFDPFVTGGPGGQHWSHIELAEPMPNPMFARSIAEVLDLRPDDISDVVAGTKKLPGGLYGGRGIKEALSKINVDAELEKTKRMLADPKITGGELNKLNSKYKALRNLKETGKKPQDAWTIQAVPVIPPIFRPQGMMADGKLKVNPLNQLYRRLGMVNETLKKGESAKIPYNTNLQVRAGLYQELQNLFGTTPKGKKALDLDMRGTREDPKKTLPGIIHMLSGDQPKDGFFQKKLVAKKQDYTARAPIVADPTLSADEIAVPTKVALELMRPMVAQHLSRINSNPEQVHRMISEKHPMAIKALEKELEHRPVLMKRDPVLHQYSIVGQKVKLTEEPAVKVSPLILPPIGGDIDGDQVALMVPLGHEAVEEVKRVMPSQRPLSDSSGDVFFKPENESALSLYRMSLPRGNRVALSFKSQADAEKAFLDNKIALNDVITVQGIGKTTLGRVRIASLMPEQHKASILTDLSTPFDKKRQATVLKDVAKNHPKNFLELADGLSRLGFKMAYESGHSVTLKDLEPLRREREKLVSETKKKVDSLLAKGKSEEATQEWLNATRTLHDIYEGHYKKSPTNVSDMAAAGIKAKREQFQGLVMAPMLVEDHLGRPSRAPVTRSFAEGVDVGGYFLQASGARRGVIQKVDSVREPGYMSKLLIQNNIDQPITAKDCGTASGIMMSTGDKDVVDRYLAHGITAAGISVPAGATVTPDLLAKLAKAKIDKVLVRSPLKCRMPHGVCSKCMGLHPTGHDYHIGENAGVISAQALGERAAQIMLKQTHGGGIVSTKGQSVDQFADVQSIFNASSRSANDAHLAKQTAEISRVAPSPRGGWEIHFKGRPAIHTMRKPLAHIKSGYQVRRGEKLTEGEPNVHDVLATQGLEAVQNYMTKRIGDIYSNEGVLRRHVELAVRNSTGLVRVTDPGDHEGVVRGDYMMKPVIDELNRKSPSSKPIQAKAVLKPVGMIPLHRQKDWMARLQGERIGKHIMTAAQHGESTDLQGMHPIPALAHGAAFGTRKSDVTR